MAGTPSSSTTSSGATTSTGVTTSGAVRRAVALCGLGAVLVVALATSAAAASALKPPPETNGGKEVAGATPKLSISVDNGRTAAKEGDRLTYTVAVRNIGTTDARKLHLTQSMPPGLRFVSADGHGSVRDGQVVWTADVPAGKDVTFHTTAQVQATPEDLLRLATVACAAAGSEGKPIVCAAHSDQLPAGAAAAEAARREASPLAGRLWYVPAGVGLLILTVLGVRAGRRANLPARLRRSP